MDMLAVGLLMRRSETMSVSHSALPDAPVIPYVEPAPRLRRVRVEFAAVRRRIATVVGAPSRAKRATSRPAAREVSANGVSAWDESRCTPSRSASA